MTSRPKILMLATQLGYGGAETSFIRLANLLAASMDVTVALFTRDYGQGHEALNAEIVELDSGAALGRVQRWWRRISKIHQLKKQHDATISFLSGPNIVNVFAGYNAGTIVSLRGSRIYDPVISVWVRRLLQYVLDPIVFRFAASIVAVSPGLKNEVRQCGGENAVAKVSVITPFVELDLLTSRRTAPLPAPYEQLRGQKVIVGVGRLSVEKGFHHLIRVFSEISKQQNGVKLLLVGDGAKMESLRALCGELGIRTDDTATGVSSVLFAGYQANTLPLIALGKVYAMTSATEGLPNVVLEALAAGVPVVAADTPWGARAVLSKNSEPLPEPYPTRQAMMADYGILMPRIDLLEYQGEWVRTLTEMLREEGQNAYTQKGCERVRDFDIAVVGAEWIKLIHKVTGRA